MWRIRFLKRLKLRYPYALNCPTNHLLMKEFGFLGFLGTPCVSDSGLALGIGLYEIYKKVPDIRFNLQNAYYGDSDNSLVEAIKENKLVMFIGGIEDFDVNKTVDDIREQPIVWFNDRAEIGPRALGNRSIIADPTNPKSKDFLNKVKQREWWRPVAPIILESHVSEWFEDAYESPYMLHTFKIIHDKEETVTSILHLDGTARVQTLKEHENLLSDVILQFYRLTGVPILCNTSLNDRGEPIINTIAQALNFALRKNIVIVYFNGIRIKLKSHEKYTVDKPCQRDTQYIFPYDECEKQNLLEKDNPFHISKSDLITYYSQPRLRKTIDLGKEKDIQVLKRYNKMLLNKIQWNHFEL